MYGAVEFDSKETLATVLRTMNASYIHNTQVNLAPWHFPMGVSAEDAERSSSSWEMPQPQQRPPLQRRGKGRASEPVVSQLAPLTTEHLQIVKLDFSSMEKRAQIASMIDFQKLVPLMTPGATSKTFTTEGGLA